MNYFGCVGNETNQFSKVTKFSQKATNVNESKNVFERNKNKSEEQIIRIYWPLKDVKNMDGGYVIGWVDEDNQTFCVSLFVSNYYNYDLVIEILQTVSSELQSKFYKVENLKIFGRIFHEKQNHGDSYIHKIVNNEDGDLGSYHKGVREEMDGKENWFVFLSKENDMRPHIKSMNKIDNNKQKHVHIILYYPPDDNHYFFAQPMELSSILINACKYDMNSNNNEYESSNLWGLDEEERKEKKQIKLEKQNLSALDKILKQINLSTLLEQCINNKLLFSCTLNNVKMHMNVGVRSMQYSDEGETKHRSVIKENSISCKEKKKLSKTKNLSSNFNNNNEIDNKKIKKNTVRDISNLNNLLNKDTVKDNISYKKKLNNNVTQSTKESSICIAVFVRVFLFFKFSFFFFSSLFLSLLSSSISCCLNFLLLLKKNENVKIDAKELKNEGATNKTLTQENLMIKNCKFNHCSKLSNTHMFAKFRKTKKSKIEQVVMKKEKDDMKFFRFLSNLFFYVSNFVYNLYLLISLYFQLIIRNKFAKKYLYKLYTLIKYSFYNFNLRYTDYYLCTLLLHICAITFVLLSFVCTVAYYQINKHKFIKKIFTSQVVGCISQFYIRLKMLVQMPVLLHNCYEYKNIDYTKYIGNKLILLNTITLILIDIIIGIIAYITLYAYSDAVLNFTHKSYVFLHKDILKACANWLTIFSEDLNLNKNLNNFIVSVLQNIIITWYEFIFVISPLKPFFVRFIYASSLFGLSFQLALLSDIINLFTLHVFYIYMIGTRLLAITVYSMCSLFQLFRGFKWNVLRQRVDSNDYDIEQMLIGTMLFTILVFIFPTIFIFYVCFLLVWLLIIGCHCIIRFFLTTLNHFPFYLIILHVVDPQTFSSGISLHILPDNTPISICYLLAIKKSGICSFFSFWTYLQNAENGSSQDENSCDCLEKTEFFVTSDGSSYFYTSRCSKYFHFLYKIGFCNSETIKDLSAWSDYTPSCLCKQSVNLNSCIRKKLRCKKNLRNESSKQFSLNYFLANHDNKIDINTQNWLLNNKEERGVNDLSDKNYENKRRKLLLMEAKILEREDEKIKEIKRVDFDTDKIDCSAPFLSSLHLCNKSFLFCNIHNVSPYAFNATSCISSFDGKINIKHVEQFNENACKSNQISYEVEKKNCRKEHKENKTDKHSNEEMKAITSSSSSFFSCPYFSSAKRQQDFLRKKDSRKKIEKKNFMNKIIEKKNETNDDGHEIKQHKGKDDDTAAHMHFTYDCAFSKKNNCHNSTYYYDENTINNRMNNALNNNNYVDFFRKNNSNIDNLDEHNYKEFKENETIKVSNFNSREETYKNNNAAPYCYNPYTVYMFLQIRPLSLRSKLSFFLMGLRNNYKHLSLRILLKSILLGRIIHLQKPILVYFAEYIKKMEKKKKFEIKHWKRCEHFKNLRKAFFSFNSICKRKEKQNVDEEAQEEKENCTEESDKKYKNNYKEKDIEDEDCNTVEIYPFLLSNFPLFPYKTLKKIIYTAFSLKTNRWKLLIP